MGTRQVNYCSSTGSRFNLSAHSSVFIASTIAIFLAGGAQASTITEDFSWTGSDGYTMTGSFSYPSSLSGAITGSQLTSFSMEVFLDGTEVGSWNLSSGYAGYTFNFNFNATTLTFFQGAGDLSYGPMGQDWDDLPGLAGCPDSGVGFASGSAEQGVCVNNTDEGFTSTYNLTATSAVASAPEPAAVSMTLIGIAGLAMGRRWLNRARRVRN